MVRRDGPRVKHLAEMSLGGEGYKIDVGKR